MDSARLPWFDSHAHLDRRFFSEDLEAVIARAFEAGLDGIVTIGASADPAEMEEAVAVAEAHDRIWAAVGIHPHEADRATPESFAALERLLARPRVVAVGETGLDFHYDLSSRDRQAAVFRRQVALATGAGKPLVLHVREAHDACLALLRSESLPWPPGVVHCYTGDLETARQYVDLGFKISIPGVVTFRNAGDLADAVRGLRAEDLLVETDSPYLAPVPMRGRKNEPAFVRFTGEAVATLKGLTPADVARVTALTARRLFGIEAGEALVPRLAYPIRDALYVNVTNRCTLRCTFCSKFRDWVVKGHNLRLPGDPPAEELWAALQEAGFQGYREVVFCGYGEPLLRWEVVRDLALRVKAAGVPTRVNTDGLASLVSGRDVAAALEGAVDALSVSLNAPDGATYASVCRSRYGEEAFRAVCDFIRGARAHVPDVTASVVALPGLDLEACRRLAEDDLQVRFRVRPLDDPG
jgi:TatD DNase family protein